MPSDVTVEQLLLDDSFIKYCLEPDDDTVQKWERLISGNYVDRITVDEAKALVRMLSPMLDKTEISDEVNKLRDTIAEQEEEVAIKRKPSLSRFFVAAALALIVFTVVFFAIRPSKMVSQATLASFSTRTGEQKKIVLPDGSTVILNSNTTLTYDKGYNENSREVFLKGKAFFNVAKNASKPFSVNSDRFTTTALGTSFYVISDSSDIYSVKLLEGKVQIKEAKENETAILNAGEEIQWEPIKNNFEMSTYDTAYLSNWVSGRIVFRKTPVSEAIDVLKRWYGVNIVLNTAGKKDVAINGTYENVSLEDILKVICFSLNCEIHYEEDRIVIQ